MPIVAPCAARFACVFNNCATLFFSACPIGEYQTQFLPRNFSGDVSPRDAPRTAGWVCVEFRRKGGVTTWQKKPLRKLRHPQSPLQKPLRSQPRKPLSNQPRKPLRSPLQKPLSNQPLNQPRSLLRKLLPNRLRSPPRKPLRSPPQKPLSNQPRKPLRSPPLKPPLNQLRKLLRSQSQRKLQPRSKLRDNTRAFARVFFMASIHHVN